MPYFLAVDVGGTKTDYVLADEISELARVRTGSIKRLRADAATAARNLDEGLRELTAKTGVAMSEVTRTCVGTAGESVPLVVDWLRGAFRAKVAGELVVVGDIEIALDAAFAGGPGVLVLAGTGSNVAGRTPGGVVCGAGGWGPALGDEGSGHRIGKEALKAACRALDEGRESALMAEVMGFWEVGTVGEVVEIANGTPGPDWSCLTELVLGCAQNSDQLAAEVLQSEGEALARQVRVVIRRLRAFNDAENWEPEMAFAGSILGKVAPVREALVRAVRGEFSGVKVRQGVVDPIAGAVWRARRG